MPSSASSRLILIGSGDRNRKGLCYCLLGIVLSLLLLILVIGLILATKNRPADDESGRILCYVCVFWKDVEMAMSHAPKEKTCEESPVNSRKCEVGEVCGYTKITMGNKTRVERNCVNSAIGCVVRYKPNKFEYCACKEPLCRR